MYISGFYGFVCVLPACMLVDGPFDSTLGKVKTRVGKSEFFVCSGKKVSRGENRFGGNTAELFVFKEGLSKNQSENCLAQFFTAVAAVNNSPLELLWFFSQFALLARNISNAS